MYVFSVEHEKCCNVPKCHLNLQRSCHQGGIASEIYMRYYMTVGRLISVGKYKII